MEGPFRVELKCESRDLVRLTCIERHRIIHHTAVAPVPELRKNAKAAARRLLRECHLRGWSNRDIDALTAINKIP